MTDVPTGGRRCALAGLAALCLLLPACVGTYAGGPASDEPHGIVDPEEGVTLWRVDGYDTSTRTGPVRVGPGLRRLKVRIEYPMESESATPRGAREITDVNLRVEEGMRYILQRAPGEFPPFDVRILEEPLY